MIMRNYLARIFERDIDQLYKEVDLYTNEELLWKVIPGTLNSGGNLALHLIGNLNHFFGTVLTKNGYVRNRDLEFAEKNVSKKDILERIEYTKGLVGNTIRDLSDQDLESDFPVILPNQPQESTHYFLLHLYGHFHYHLGQINYHRRIIGDQ